MPRSFLITNHRYNEEEDGDSPTAQQVTVIVSPNGQGMNGNTYKNNVFTTSPMSPLTPTVIKRNITFHTPPDDHDQEEDLQDEPQDLSLSNRRRNSNDEEDEGKLLDLSGIKKRIESKGGEDHVVQQVTGCLDGRQLVMMITSTRHGLTSVGVHPVSMSGVKEGEEERRDGEKRRIGKEERIDPRQHFPTVAPAAASIFGFTSSASSSSVLRRKEEEKRREYLHPVTSSSLLSHGSNKYHPSHLPFRSSLLHSHQPGGINPVSGASTNDIIRSSSAPSSPISTAGGGNDRNTSGQQIYSSSSPSPIPHRVHDRHRSSLDSPLLDGRSQSPFECALSTSSGDCHICPDCGKRYSTSSNLARHRQTHRSVTDKKARKCPHCDKVYVSMPAYSMHVRTHSQSCQCIYCGKCFSRPWLLQGHIRTHTGEKPFKCHICTKAFADKSNLRAHVQTHSSSKPYVCERCGKAFALKSYLYKHEESSCMRLHRSNSSSSNNSILNNQSIKGSRWNIVP